MLAPRTHGCGSVRNLLVGPRGPNTDKSEMDFYQYIPIEDTEYRDGIRLIYLLPGKAGDEIRVVLLGRCLNKASLVCDNGRLDITRNLYDFLQQIRDTATPVTLWADAICIDQSNIAERNSQVQRMRNIYSKAQRVLIWLGVSDGGSDDAIRLVKRLQSSDSHTQNPLLSFTGAGIAPIADSVWGFLADLFNRPYFQRVWVVQEVALSQSATVLCGSSSISWDDLVQSASYIQATGVSRLLGKVRLNEIGNIEMARQDHSRSITRSPLNLLLRQRACIATDPRDQVFALYGLSEAAFHELRLDPDYGVETAELYRNAAAIMLERSSSLDVLGVPRSLRPLSSLSKALPSWVPDWSGKDTAISLLRLENETNGCNFMAAGRSKSSPTFDSDHRHLGLEGYSIDVIDAVSLTLGNNGFVNIRADLYNTWKQHVSSTTIQHMEFHSVDRVTRLRSMKTYNDGQDPMDVYWVTLRAGYCPEGFEKARQSFHAWDKSFHSLEPVWFNHHFLFIYFLVLTIVMAILTMARHKLGIDAPMIKPEVDFMNRCAFRQRRVFRTKKGFVGLGPGLAERGDQIALCNGGKSPLVIRKRGSVHELLGDCFIYGMMNGQHWEEKKCHRIWLV